MHVSPAGQVAVAPLLEEQADANAAHTMSEAVHNDFIRTS
jgi:hypothetical protein